MSSSIQPKSPRNEKCDNEAVVDKRSSSVFDSFVVIRIRDWIRVLVSATDFQLFWIGVVARFVISVSMVTIFTVAGYFVDYSTNTSLLRDNSFLLSDHMRLISLRMWDGVHFFHVASAGYDLEVKLAFFPGFPAIIKMISFFTSNLFPFLTTIFPEVFYVMLLNLVLNGLTLVILRKLTISTYLGPLGLKCFQHNRFQWTRCSYWTAQTGSMLDSPLRTQDPLLSKDGEDVDWRLAIKKATAATARHRSELDVVIGAICFVWLIIPANIHASVAYTEPVFGLSTMLFIYLLHRNPKEIPGIDESNSEEVEAVENQLWELYYSGKPVKEALSDHLTARSCSSSASTSDISSLDAKKPEGRIKVEFKQDLVSKNEILAELLLIVTGTIRSNTILSTGFFWYPIFIQLFLPSLYRRRVLEWYAPQWWGVGGKKITEGNSKTKKKSTMYWAKKDTTTIVIHGVHGLGRRVSFCRVLVLLLFTFMAFGPFLSMNYIGWRRFGLLWSMQEKALYGTNFFNFYSSIQNRFWGVGLFNAFLLTNIPHILIPVPFCILTVASLRYILWSDLRLPFTNSKKENAALQLSRSGILNTFKSELRLFFWYVERFLSSSSICLLLVQLTICILVMNINVLPRFIMGLPSVYWLFGSFVAREPTHLIARVTPFVFVMMTLGGMTLFSLNFDWT